MLTRPWNERRPHYDVVVVGSGYGGSIAAARFAMADLSPRLSVCLLERGREWPVGRFPDRFETILSAFRSALNPLGLYEMVTGRDISVIKGSGLGGTSLVNANVAIVPEAEVFEQAGWPASVTRAALLPYYERARQVLAGVPHPRAANLLKVQALDRRARELDTAAFALDLAVNHTIDGMNPHGVVQRPCIDCGDCVTGCNVGAKNTLPMNYLPMAANAGAELFTQAQVDFVRKLPDGRWQVHGTRFENNAVREPFHLTASHVVLAAGAINTTEILLRSEARGLTVSSRLGSGFGGNGDFFGLAYNGDHRTDVLGFGNRPQSPRRAFAPGPTIVAGLKYDGQVPPDQRFLIQDLSFPSGYVDAARHAFALLPREDTDAGDELEEVRRAARDRNPFLPAQPNGALNHTMLYLCMGIDDAKGSILLERTPFDPEGEPRIVWDQVGRQAIFTRINEELRRHARAQGASFIPAPLWTGFDARHLVTAHPLGGCPLGEDYDQGAVDEYGRVFAGDGEVHDGLFVTDGALVPSALGANPFLTISALAERIVERKIQQLQGQEYPAPPASVGVSTIDAIEVSTYNEAQLERLFGRVQSRGIEVLVNAGGHQIDASRQVIRDDTYWKGFFPSGHVLNAMSSALFTGFKKRFTREGDRFTGMTSDTDGRINARNTLEPITIDRRQGDLDPGEYILLRYVDPPWQGYYDIFKVVNDDLLLGRVYLGVYPHGLRLFTFPMTRARRFEQMTVADHRTLYQAGGVPDPAQLHGVWRMDVVSNANHLAAAAHLWFDLKPDGRLESRYQLLGLFEGLVVPSVVEDHFRLADFTPFHDEIRSVTADFLVGKWITTLPASAGVLPPTSLGILHFEEDAGERRVGFYYTLSRTGTTRFETGTLLSPFLDVQLPAGVGLSFEEEMVGWYFPGMAAAADERETARAVASRVPPGGAAPAGAVPCRFRLKMAIPDLNTFIDGAAREARPDGSIRFETFEGSTPASFRIDDQTSSFSYLRVNEATGEAEMRYHLEFQTPDERRYVFEGRKYMERSSPLRRQEGRHTIAELLEDYTTLYVRVAKVTAAGEEHLGLAYMKFRTFEDLFAVRDLAGFLRSFTVTGTQDPLLQLQAQIRFLAFTAQFVQREYDPLAPAPVG